MRRAPVSKREIIPAGVAPDPQTANVNPALILFLFLAALAFRLLHLGRADLWQDEMLFANQAQPSLTPGDVWRQYMDRWLVAMAWLPLPAYIENLHLRFFGQWVADITHATFWVRLPGAIFGSLAVPAAYMGFRRITDRVTALIASLFMCATFYPIYFSREVHAYPLLLLLATAEVWCFANIVSGRPTARNLLAFAGTTAALLYTHLTATMFFAGFCITILACWLVAQFRSRNKAEARKWLQLGMVSAALGVLLVPIYIRILGGGNPHLQMHQSANAGFVINDVVTKLFLGDLPAASVVAWLVFAAGTLRFIRTKGIPRVFMGVLAAAFILILMAAMKTQYLSSRYFATVAPLLLLVFAAGFREWGERIARFRPRVNPAMAAGFLSAAVIAIHVVVFLPKMYLLQSKSVDFGGVARWLNAHLSPGTAYLLNSAYELRLVPGYFDTPGLVGASAYVHGPGDAETARLEQYQRRFLEQFPDAVYVESEMPAVPWPWPREFFARSEARTNEQLVALALLGIHSAMFRKDLRAHSQVTMFLFNTPDDLEAQARRRGESVVLQYPGATCRPYANVEQGRATLYAHYWLGRRATIHIAPVGGTVADGVLEFQGALAASEGDFDVVFRAEGREGVRQRMKGGQFGAWRIPLRVERAETFVWEVEGASAGFVEALAADGFRFSPGR